MKKERSLVDNVSSPSQVESAKTTERLREKRYRDALERLANTPEGELLFERIAEKARFFVTSFSTDPLQMAHDEGKRTLGLELLAEWILARPDAMAHLLAQRALEAKRNGG